MNRIELISHTLSKIPPSAPFTMVDVGSMGGIEKEWAAVGPQIRTIGFEPDLREFGKLKAGPNEVFFNCALHRSDALPLTIYLSKEPGKSSIFPPNMERLRGFPNSDRFETVGTAELPADRVRSLDSLIKSECLGRVHFIKLDTQGSELFILEGAKEALNDSVVGVKVEVEFQQLYQGQPLFSDVDQFLRAAGYDLVDIRRVFWRKNAHPTFSGKGQLVFGDALYLRSDQALRNATRRLPAASRLSTVLGFAAVGLAYGSHDTVCEALQDAASADPENRPLFDELVQLVEKYDRSHRVPRFWGSEKVFRLLDRLGKAIGHQRHEFAECDIELGNRRIS